MGACAAMCMCVDMPTCMCSIVRVYVCATAYVYVYAYVRLRNLQERIETRPTEILTNVAGRELDALVAVGTEDEVRGARRGDHRLHLSRREVVPHVADLLLDMHRAVGLQDVSNHGTSPFTHICGCGCVDMCGCAVERLRVYAKVPAGASAPTMVSVSGSRVLRGLAGRGGDLAGEDSSAAEDAAAFRAPAAMEAGVLPGLTQP